MKQIIKNLFLLCLIVQLAGSMSFAQHGWVVTTYTNSTTAYGIVTINGSPASAGDVVGAFVGSECRAFQEVQIYEGNAYVTLIIQGQTVETVSFKVWDSSTNTILGVAYTTQTNPGGQIGSAENFLPLAAFSTTMALRVNPDSRSVTYPAGTTTFSVSNSGSGNMNWNASVISGSSWCTITGSSTGTNSGTITCSYTQNTGISSRTATIRITATGASGSPKDVTIIQNPSDQPVLSVTPDSRSVTYPAGTTTFSVSNSGSGSMNWNASVISGSSWCTINGSSTGTNSGTITCSYTQNTGTSSRTATIRITATGASGSPKDVIINQHYNQSSEEWSDSFETYNLGSFPSTWIADANGYDVTTNKVVNTTSSDGSKSLQLFGQIDGCWGALAYRSLTVTDHYYIEVDVKNGNESLSGCHPDRGCIGIRQGTSWLNSAREFVRFSGDGIVYGAGNKPLMNYTTNTWYSVLIEYKKVSSNKVILSFWIDGMSHGSLTVLAIPEENSLNNLEFCTQEGTVWFDKVKVSKNNPLGISQDLPLFKVKVYPNPSDGEIFIDFTNYDFNNKIIEVFDLTGQMVMKQSVFSHMTRLNLDSYGKGVYFLLIKSNSSTIRSFKMLIK